MLDISTLPRLHLIDAKDSSVLPIIPRCPYFKSSYSQLTWVGIHCTASQGMTVFMGADRCSVQRFLYEKMGIFNSCLEMKVVFVEP